MAFMKRLGYYLLGLAIGLIFLAVFLKKKSEGTGASFCYFPNCRVLKELRSKPYDLSQYQGMHLDSVLIAGFLTEGSVRFKESDARAEPCPIYVIDHKIDGRSGRLHVANCAESVLITGFSFN